MVIYRKSSELILSHTFSLTILDWCLIREFHIFMKQLFNTNEIFEYSSIGSGFN
jgi:hypothetical protein